MHLARLVIPVLLAASIWAVAAQRGHLASELEASTTAEDVYYLPADTRVLEALTLQYREAGADLLWMKALLYYADHLAGRSAAEFAVNYGRALITLDPDFVEAYKWVGWVPFYLSVETPMSMKLAGVRLLIQGSDHLPNDGDLAWEAAATVTYELLSILPPDAPEREALEAESERLLARTVRLGAGPPWLALNSASASVRLGRTEVAIQNLQRTLALTDDPALRAQLLDRLAVLSSGSRHLELQEEHRRLSRLRIATFPYLDDGEFLVLGERRFPIGEELP